MSHDNAIVPVTCILKCYIFQADSSRVMKYGLDSPDAFLLYVAI